MKIDYSKPENITKIVLTTAVLISILLTLSSCSTTKEACKEETKKECCSKK